MVAGLQPYVPGEQPRPGDLVKLNTNEMPFGPSPAVLEAIRAATGDELRLYSDPESRVLRQAYADALDISPAQVLPGNGSDEVLAHAFRALFQPGLPVLYPDITYSFYPVYARFFGLEAETVALNERFEIDLADYRRPNGGIIFPNPNAPTGIAIPLDQLAALLEDNRDSVVVVDEAYVDFGAESAVALIGDYPNLLVIQTMSKSRALAGLRVGAAFGQEELIEGLERVKNSFNAYPLDRLAEAGAVASLGDEAWFRQACASIISGREELTAGLQQLGFEVLPSMANFVFARHPDQRAVVLLRGLRERGIVVRHFDQPRIDDFIRITIGSPEQCRAVLDVLGELLD
jgi:histidinol-phosphate aminotransferase